MSAYAIAGFTVAILPLIATPGASFAILAQRVVQHGRSKSIPVILGTVTGLYLHATLAAAGLSALVMRSSELFTAVKLAGAAYLIALGVWTWRERGTASAGGHRTVERSRPLRWLGRSTYAQALLANGLNPKAALIFLTLVPQFLDPRLPVMGQVFTLATAFALLITAWLLGWTVVIHRAGHVLRRTSVAKAVRRTTSAMLVGLGVRAAVV